jgi:hypothetical protein
MFGVMLFKSRFCQEYSVYGNLYAFARLAVTLSQITAVFFQILFCLRFIIVLSSHLTLNKITSAAEEALLRINQVLSPFSAVNLIRNIGGFNRSILTCVLIGLHFKRVN